MNINCVVFDSTITNGNTTMDTKALRQKILDLAIRGKLVPQDPNDEPASVLLERIKAEKERLIKEGKIKRSKKAAKTSDTPHYPYLLPNGWEWRKLEEIVCELKYGTSEKSLSEGKIAVLRMGNITNIGTIDYSNLAYSSNDEDIEQYSLKKDDLLFNRTNSSEWVGKTAIYKEEQPAIYAGYLIRIRPIGFSSDFLNAVMNSSYYRNWCYNVKKDAVNQSNINAQKLSQLMIPIPPLEEQGRIVIEIERWLSLIGQIEQGKTDLQTTIKQAKSKILDLAIHGKLVPQDPNDEPAIELLKRINPNFTPCDNGHYPLNVPSGWIWTTLKDSISLKSGIHIKVRDNTSGIYPIYGGNGVNGSFNEYNVERNTIIIGRVGFYCGSVHLTDSKSWITDNALIVTKNELYDTSYLVYLLKYLDLGRTSNSTAQPVVSGKGILPLQVPLPPLAEQQRIVAKIEEIFSILDGIQNEGVS